jgi:hypothetical protein
VAHPKRGVHQPSHRPKHRRPRAAAGHLIETDRARAGDVAGAIRSRRRRSFTIMSTARRRRSGGGPRILRALALTLALALALPEGAVARIVVDRGVGGVRIGMTARQVRAALGRADDVERSGATSARIYRSRKLVVTLSAGRVQIVSTRSRRERTARGVGPGSTLRALRAGLRGERCGTKAGVDYCKVGSGRSGRRSTVFLLVGGIVDTVSVARAP